MTNPTRRSVLRGSLALATAGSLVRPFIAKAAAKTATVWWVQGFAEEEDVAFKKLVADYEKASGNTIDYTLIPFAPHRQKIVSLLAPDHRTRRALLHLSYSCAPQTTHAALVTHDPKQTLPCGQMAKACHTSRCGERVQWTWPHIVA